MKEEEGETGSQFESARLERESLWQRMTERREALLPAAEDVNDASVAAVAPPARRTAGEQRGSVTRA